MLRKKKSFPMISSFASVSHYRFVGTLLLLSFGVASVFFGVSVSAQQTYPGWRMTEKAEQEAKNAKTVSNALQAGTLDTQLFEPYFKTYYFHRWTQPKNIDNLSTYVRKDFLATDLDKATGPAREYLLKTSLQALEKMRSNPAVSPSARYNAVLALGLLYDDSGKTKLYAPALPILIDEFNNPAASQANQLGALIGIVRYAQLGIEDQALRENVVPGLLEKVVLEKKPPKDRTEDVHNLFFRVRALEGLAGLCRTVGPKKEFVDLFLTLILDGEEPDELRYLAAKALAEINYAAAAEAGTNLSVDQIAGAIIKLAQYACDGEQKFIDELRRSEQVKSSSGAKQLTTGTKSGSANDSKLEQSITRNKFAFGSIQEAIKGFGAIRSETNLLTALNKAGTPESKRDAVVLEKMLKLIDEHFRYLNNGPGAADDKKSSSSRSGSGRTSAGPKTYKVTIENITNGLIDLAVKIDELLEETSLPDENQQPKQAEQTEETAEPADQGADVDF